MVEECQSILDDRPLRQGDVFEWVEGYKDRPWKIYGVVVTADCDLANYKTRGILSFVPILTDAEYFWMTWRIDKMGPAIERFATESAARVSKQIKKRYPDHKGITSDGLKAWLDRAQVAGVIAEIGLSDKGQIKEFEERLNKLQSGLTLMQSDIPNYEMLRDVLPIKNSKASPNNFDSLTEEFRNSVTSLPGDTFFFSKLPGSNAGGHFAMLRHISQCPISAVAINREQLEFDGAEARRIARMGAPYLYAMTQGLGRVFTDIGLPSDYEDSRKASPSDLLGAQR